MSWEMYRLKETFYKRYGTYCWCCGKKFDKKELSGHHIVPKSKGGQITEDNIAILCLTCHFAKVNYIPYDSEEYRKLMFKLRQWKASHEHSE